MSEKNEGVLTATSSEGENVESGSQAKAQRKTPESSKSATSEKGMLDNNTYNLMEQLITENKSLWRIKNNYKNDAAMDNESKGLWNLIEKGKEEVVKLLKEKLKERL